MAAAMPGDQRLTLVIGAGCSIEHPTGMPSGGDLAEQAHQKLTLTRVIQAVANPRDLSKVADAVKAANHGLQAALIDVLPIDEMRIAKPNSGYLIAAAMQIDRVVGSTVSLNYDQAGINAFSVLGAGGIKVVHGIADVGSIRPQNFVFLHGSAALPGEDWVIGTDALDGEWISTWREVVAQLVLTTPVVVFAGLGSPAALLTSTVSKIRAALPGQTASYLIEPAPGRSDFADALALQDGHQLTCGWCEFMDSCAEVLLGAHLQNVNNTLPVVRLQAGTVANADVESVFDSVRQMGLVGYGRLRASWQDASRGQEYPRHPVPGEPGLISIADLFQFIAELETWSGESVTVEDSGIVNVPTATGTKRVVLYSSPAATDFEEARTRALLRHSSLATSASGVIVVVAHSNPPRAVSPPADILREEDESSPDVLRGPDPTTVLFLPYVRDSVTLQEKVA